MADKLTRKYQKIFASTGPSGPSGIVSQFGSYKAGSPTYSYDPSMIQALGAWGEGMNAASVNSAPPFIQDVNSVCYVISKWLFYKFEQGIAEPNSAVDYHVGSIVADKNNIDSSCGIFMSLTGNHTGQGLSGQNYWQMILRPNHYNNVTGSTGATLTAAYYDKNVHIYLGGSTTYRLPDAVPNLKGREFFIDVFNPLFGIVNITFSTPSGSNINGASSLTRPVTNYLTLCFKCTGTQWYSFNEWSG